MSRVEGTNDYSIVSKLSTAKAGFFVDSFLAEFVDKPRNRAPLINWGYYIRNKSLELTFEKAVQYFTNKGDPFQEGELKILFLMFSFRIRFYDPNF